MTGVEGSLTDTDDHEPSLFGEERHGSLLETDRKDVRLSKLRIILAATTAPLFAVELTDIFPPKLMSDALNLSDLDAISASE